ncbi:MAG: hypothetical protein CVV47_12375 [Spirochaetae bacterium HGW-Spirochaetae-3]|jgi:hypothetical protein|nr:MAG: hypothetical protein CVV47_12375 [Spirochaetae bacterium HGW-Spirochaetae-3]
MVALYSKAIGSLGPRIEALLGEVRYAAVVNGAPAEMERLVPTLPEIGRGNPFEGTIVTAAVLTAMGRTLIASAKAFGLVFRREGTLAGGADRCDCRYSRRAAP